MPGPQTKPMKLYYFGGFKAKGYLCKLALEVAGVDYTFVGLNKEEFTKKKCEFPFGQMPVLEDTNGECMCQTQAIMHYVMGKKGMCYTDGFQQCKVMEVYCCVEEVLSQVFKGCFEPKDVKCQMREEMVKTSMPTCLKNLEKIVKCNGGKCAVGDKVTMADIMIYYLIYVLKCGEVEKIPTTIVDGYPTLNKVYSDVKCMPQVEKLNKQVEGTPLGPVCPV